VPNDRVRPTDLRTDDGDVSNDHTSLLFSEDVRLLRTQRNEDVEESEPSSLYIPPSSFPSPATLPEPVVDESESSVDVSEPFEVIPLILRDVTPPIIESYDESYDASEPTASFEASPLRPLTLPWDR
jgi:hypothetical protein